MKKVVLALIVILAFIVNDLAQGVQSQHYVQYFISNKHTEDSNGDDYIDKLSFTVNWLYSGPLERPHIVYIVTIRYNDTILKQFQDSAIGQITGSKDYVIYENFPLHIEDDNGYQIAVSIVGSDGSYL